MVIGDVNGKIVNTNSIVCRVIYVCVCVRVRDGGVKIKSEIHFHTCRC